MPRAVRVILGLSAAGTLKQAIHPHRDELLVTDDVLSCGPLRPFQTPMGACRYSRDSSVSHRRYRDGRRIYPRAPCAERSAAATS
jgi:hypothetical protein